MNFDLDDFLSSGTIMSLPQERLLIAWGKTYFSSSPIENGQSDIQPSFYLSDFFFTSTTPWIHYSKWMEISIVDFKKVFAPVPEMAAAEWIVDQGERFKEAFDQLMHSLKTDHLKKAVPYLFAKSSTKMTKERLCHSLLRGLGAMEKGAGYLYGCWNNSEGILGITPELLFSHTHCSAKKVQTMAVAGTCHPEEDIAAFFQDEKQRYEHNLVIQGISQSLQNLGVVNVGATQLLRLPKLIHLMTPIEVNLFDQFQFDDVVKQLHPTPALGAFPKNEGKQWLRHFNQHTPRHYYGAPIGFRDPVKGISRCFVAIRNVQWNNSGMLIGAGCGVVKQSTFEKEWHEIQIKIKAIRAQLGL